MPLVAHRELESLNRLRQEGQEILDINRASQQDIRELHIGLLNIMPDGALRATERQFLRLIGNSNRIAQFYVHIFTVPGVPRSPEMQRYIETHYERFDDLAKEGLDAIIFTGTNPVHADLSQEAYWPHVQQIFDWADKNVTSVLCSCLASHIALHHFYGIKRQRREEKLFGVFNQRVLDKTHPILSNINTRFDMPHSRWNSVTAEQLAAHGLPVLVAGQDSGVSMACSPDGFRQIYFQGHPEYDCGSLMKEYRRDLQLYQEGKKQHAPYLPAHYFTPKGIRIIHAFIESQRPMEEFPESQLLDEVDVTWRDTAKALFANWLGLVYQLTHKERHLQFMDGIDPADPLGRLQHS
ncbi:MAG: homoserine O-succinyltransferase [Cardiobacteriaceae bacterium]|nr:homoserine O-succinyltransferase [Cardiobacteriaceae bacterium]